MACQRDGIGNEMPEQHQYNVPLIQYRTECSITPASKKSRMSPLTTDYRDN
jgi:hypothetical protein